MPTLTGIVGRSVADKVRFANVVFTVVVGLILLLTNSWYDWVTGVYMAVAIVALLVSYGIDFRERHKGEKLFDRQQDLDRPGGPYDHLHGRS